jgi:hypothetical protein
MGLGAGNIYHPAALGTDQMGVGLYNAVKPFFPIHNPHGHNQSLMAEKVDIPVHRAQG